MRADATKRSSGISPRLVQPVFPIHPIAEVNAGIFAWLDESIKAELSALAEEPVAEDKILLQSFFNWALHKLDAGAYASLQTKHIEVERARVKRSGICKYLNFTYYMRRKMPQLHRLGLHQGRRKRILDVGCGPGHFQLLARYFGHEALGLDLPFVLYDTSLYDDLCDFFGVFKVDHRIEPMQPLPRFSDRFDLVTVFSTQFDFDSEQRPWDVRAWRAFVDDVCDNALTHDGALYLTLTGAERPSEALNYLNSVAEWTHNNRALLIRRTRTRKSAEDAAMQNPNVRKLEEQLHKTEEQLHKIEEQSRERDEQIHQLEEQLHKTEEQRHKIEEQSRERDEQIRHLENSLKGKMTKQKAKIHRLGQRLGRRDQQIGQMKSSVSWRVTAPLRWLKPRSFKKPHPTPGGRQ